MITSERDIKMNYEANKEIRFSERELSRINGGKSKNPSSSGNGCCTRNQTQSAEKIYSHEGDYDSAREQENM